MKQLSILLLLFYAFVSKSQVLYQREIPVTINGLTTDAMEPFISPDGGILFYNSLNDGINTSLYHATRINDSVFQHQGIILNVNHPAPHLDAVASMDNAGNFFWVTTRDYPAIYENLFTGNYSNGVVTNITRVYGDIYTRVPGWLIMDACVSFQGAKLIYANAYFNNCSSGLPCEASLSVATKVNDSTFMRSAILSNELDQLNDTNFLVYAPQLSADGRELYYTRLQKNTIETQICVAVRNSTSAPFPQGTVLYSYTGAVPEAPTISPDNSELFYHRKEAGQYQLFMRKRTLTDLNEIKENQYKVFLSGDEIRITRNENINKVMIMDMLGKVVFTQNSVNKNVLLISTHDLIEGIYLVVADEHRELIKVNR